jgi:hypothetical protein
MALVSVRRTRLPSLDAHAVANGPSYVVNLVDADGEGIALIFQAPVTGTITGFGLPTGTVTAGDADMDFRLETVTISATPAVPSGSLAAANTNASVNVNASNSWFNGVLTASYAATAGELLALKVVRKTAGSFNGNFRTFGEDGGNTIVGFPMGSVNASGGWVALAAGSAPCFALNYGGTYYPIDGVWPCSAITTTTFDSTLTPDVIGNIWIPRVKCRVVGVYVWLDLDGATTIKFYDTDGVSVLATATAAANTRIGTSPGIFSFPFNTSVTPTVGSTYRIGVEPSSATGLTIYDFTVPSAAVMDAWGLGQDMYKTSAKDPSGLGSWTDVTTQRVFLGVIVDAFDDGVQVGGASALPFVTQLGAMRV